MTGPVRDPRAGVLLRRYHERFWAPGLPVPVEAIAEDLLGLSVEELDLDGASGLLYPAERQIYVNASEPAPRRRFTLAHELGHWVCQCLEGRAAPMYCRTEEVGVGEGRLLEREANLFAAELVMPEDAVRTAWGGGVAQTATCLGVSEEAMHWRLYNLSLVAERPT